MNRFLFNFFYLKTSISLQRYNIKVKRSIFISWILRNTFPVKFYYHFSLVNWTAATECATSSEHAHCAWYEMLIMMQAYAYTNIPKVTYTMAISTVHLLISETVRNTLRCVAFKRQEVFFIYVLFSDSSGVVFNHLSVVALNPARWLSKWKENAKHPVLQMQP